MAAAPLALGAVHLGTSLALAVSALLALGLLVAARPEGGIRVGWQALALAAAAALFALQLVPLPLAVLAAVAAPSAELVAHVLPGATSHALTLDVPATARELARTAGLGALLVVLQHRAWDSRRARRRALLAIAGAGAAVALVGLAHLSVSARSLFGLWTPSLRPAFLTTFGNANHLAGYLDVAALLCLGLAIASEERRARFAAGAGFAVTMAGSLLAGSRGGMIALGAGMALLPLLGLRASRDGAAEADAPPPASKLVALAAALLLGLGGVLYAAMPSFTREVDSMAEVELEQSSKLGIARTALRVIEANAALGIGRGAFGTAHPRYLEGPTQATFTHVENEPLQLVTELGIPLGLALVLAVGLAWLGLARRGRASWTEAGAAAAAFAILAHGLVDFSLHFAAGYALAALVAFRPAVAALRFRLAPPKALGALAAAAVAVGGGAVLAWPGLAADTDRLLALAADPVVSRERMEAEVAAALAKRPADYLACEAAAHHALRTKGGAGRALAWANRALFLNPHTATSHALAGEALARVGRRDQALLELRTAASLGLPTMATVLARFPEREAILAAAPPETEPAAAAAEVLVRAGRHEEAALVAAAPAAAAPGHRGLATLLHGALTHLGRHEEALPIAARFRDAAAPADRAAALALEAGTLARLGRFDDARARYDEGLRQAAGDVALVHGLAYLELQRKAPDAALAALDRAPLPPSLSARATRHELRARALRAKGELSRAVDELRLGLRLQPDRQDLLLALAEVYFALGRVEDAARELAPVPETLGAARTLRARIAKHRADAAAATPAAQRGPP